MKQKCDFLFKDIQKYTDRAGEDTKALKKALEVMCIVPKAANDMMQVGRLQGFDVSITYILMGLNVIYSIYTALVDLYFETIL